ncbi:hypothetical protein M434DRAFT_26943 [Hypoxylon sp. CO27-5]|nr:hypothetical protein M434DRAFT_26943 [Hypoxylon sp. CO27-5]
MGPRQLQLETGRSSESLKTLPTLVSIASIADEGVISTSQCYTLKYLETIIALYHTSPLSVTYSLRHKIAPDDAEDDDYDVVIFEPSQFTTLNLVLHEVIVSVDYIDGTESPYNVELPSWSKKSFPRTPNSKLEVPIECISHERWLTQGSSLWVIQCHQYPIQEITKVREARIRKHYYPGVTGVQGQVPSARPKLVDDYTFLQRGRTPRTTFPVRPAGTKATTHTFPSFSHHPIVSQTPLVILSFDVVPFWQHDAVNAPRSGRYLFRGFKTPIIPEDNHDNEHINDDSVKASRRPSLDDRLTILAYGTTERRWFHSLPIFYHIYTTSPTPIPFAMSKGTSIHKYDSGIAQHGIAQHGIAHHNAAHYGVTATTRRAPRRAATPPHAAGTQVAAIDAAVSQGGSAVMPRSEYDQVKRETPGDEATKKAEAKEGTSAARRENGVFCDALVGLLQGQTYEATKFRNRRGGVEDHAVGPAGKSPRLICDPDLDIFIFDRAILSSVQRPDHTERSGEDNPIDKFKACNNARSQKLGIVTSLEFIDGIILATPLYMVRALDRRKDGTVEYKYI